MVADYSDFNIFVNKRVSCERRQAFCCKVVCYVVELRICIKSALAMCACVVDVRIDFPYALLVTTATPDPA